MAGTFNQVMRISSFVSHALAWAVYLVVSFGLVIWPALRDGEGEDLKVLVTVFAPVAISGLGWLTVIIQGCRQTDRPVTMVLAVLLAAFCVLAIFSVALLRLPAMVKLAIGIIVGFYLIVLVVDVGKAGRSLLLGIGAALLLGFSVLASFSVGFLFLPTFLAMVVAALASLVVRPPPEIYQPQ